MLISLLALPFGVVSQDLVPTSSLTGGSSIFVFRKAAVRRIAPPVRAERTKTQQMASVAKVKRQYDTIAQTAPKREREKTVDPNNLPKNYRTLAATEGSKLFAGVAEYYLAEGQIDKALEFFRDSVNLDGSNTRAKGGLADALTRKGNDLLIADQATNARSYFLEALKFDPRNAGANFGLAEIFSQLGQLDEAIANYERSLSNDKDLTEIYVPLGILYYQTGQIAKADELLTKAMRTSGDAAETQFFFGLVRAIQGKTDEALAAMARAVAIDPNYADAHYNLGEMLSRLGRHDEAIISYKRAAELRPNYVEAWVGLGEGYVDKKDFAKAVEAFQAAAKLRNDSWEIFAALGDAQRQANKFADAATSYNLAVLFLSRSPDKTNDQLADLNSKAGFSIGMQCEINIQLYKPCDWPFAVSLMEKAVALSNSPFDYANLGWAYYNSARSDIAGRDNAAAAIKLTKAKEALIKAEGVDPVTADGVNQNLGAVLIDQGDFQGAIAALTKVVDKQPTWTLSRYALGTAYFKVDDLNNAAKWFKATLDNEPRYVPAMSSLGYTEIRRKNGKEVKRIVDQLKAIDPSEGLKLERQMKFAKL
jgi:tetratricopeptide (TPR) repeat protein